MLAGLEGQGAVGGDCEEYTTPAFKPPAAPPAFLVKLRAILYGPNPDRRTVLYRTHQFMTLLHQTGLAEFVTRHDARITYLPLSSGGFLLVPGLDALDVAGHGHELTVAGDAPDEDAGGRTDLAWTITITA